MGKGVGGGGPTHVSQTLKGRNNASLRLKIHVHACTEIPKVKGLYFADFGFVFLPFTLKTFKPMITENSFQPLSRGPM